MVITSPLQIGKLKFLSELQVYNNKLTELPLSLGHCSQLTLLHVGGNKVGYSVAPTRAIIEYSPCVAVILLVTV